ncbi:hypothetical protein, partial [Pseudolactococcus chungangensis]|uniref:hypothetical protein n=1 Tax=Pseudolactococcus chungangensis TaxID=451457 RepID=UPI001C548121
MKKSAFLSIFLLFLNFFDFRITCTQPYKISYIKGLYGWLSSYTPYYNSGCKAFFSLPWQTEKGLVTTVQDLKNRTHYASALRLRFS